MFDILVVNFPVPAPISKMIPWFIADNSTKLSNIFLGISGWEADVFSSILPTFLAMSLTLAKSRNRKYL